MIPSIKGPPAKAVAHPKGRSEAEESILGYIHASGFTTSRSDTDGTQLPAIDVVFPERRLQNRQLTEEL